MKRVLLLLLGWLPLLAGAVMDDLMMRYMDVRPPYLLIGVGTLLVWALLGSFTVMLKEKPASLLPLNLPAAIVLLLLVVQDGVCKAYWSNWLGVYTQLFYLPLLNLAGRLGGWLFHTIWPLYLLCFLLLCGASYLGRRLGEKVLPPG